VSSVARDITPETRDKKMEMIWAICGRFWFCWIDLDSLLKELTAFSLIKSKADPEDHFEVAVCLTETISNPILSWLKDYFLWDCHFSKTTKGLQNVSEYNTCFITTQKWTA
jgi:hypothetical protein